MIHRQATWPYTAYTAQYTEGHTSGAKFIMRASHAINHGVHQILVYGTCHEPCQHTLWVPLPLVALKLPTGRRPRKEITRVIITPEQHNSCDTNDGAIQITGLITFHIVSHHLPTTSRQDSECISLKRHMLYAVPNKPEHINKSLLVVTPTTQRCTTSHERSQLHEHPQLSHPGPPPWLTKSPLHNGLPGRGVAPPFAAMESIKSFPCLWAYSDSWT